MRALLISLLLSATILTSAHANDVTINQDHRRVQIHTETIGDIRYWLIDWFDTISFCLPGPDWKLAQKTGVMQLNQIYYWQGHSCFTFTPTRLGTDSPEFHRHVADSNDAFEDEALFTSIQVVPRVNPRLP